MALFLKDLQAFHFVSLSLSLSSPPPFLSRSLAMLLRETGVAFFCIFASHSLYLSVSLSLPLALHLRCALLRPSRQTEKCALPCNNGLLEFWGAQLLAVSPHTYVAWLLLAGRARAQSTAWHSSVCGLHSTFPHWPCPKLAEGGER